MTCNKVVIIDEGKIRASDTPAGLVNSMRRAGEVVCELKIGEEPGLAAISVVPEVTKVIGEPLENGWTRFTLLVAPETDTRERLSKLAREQNWPLRALRRHHVTLEEVFVELTRKN
jgi:ABC-2 type transport system ATP-binding protein